MSLLIEHLPLEVRSEIDRLQREVEMLRGKLSKVEEFLTGAQKGFEERGAALKKARVALMAEQPTLHDRVDAVREALRAIKECGVA